MLFRHPPPQLAPLFELSWQMGIVSTPAWTEIYKSSGVPLDIAALCVCFWPERGFGSIAISTPALRAPLKTDTMNITGKQGN